ncbi:nucleotide sugar dehydrogenase [Mumia sp. zg.B21]|uniref:nucleotide sugar dehydrogenase n=1 Tax=Mumia sp. zg.B21 TaxID=2855447 RepID=UPI001C6F3CD3|nr:nucleotide sugar dehydrogenase [Mumia sp. zg.B21]MBW9210775.1 nucleotide sugar dehydrogenase [Mumia sp. zg.B21]
MKVVVFGLGYVGTVTAAGLAREGHQVVGVDVDDMKVETIRSGCSPVVEPEIEDLVRAGVAAGALTATTDPVAALDGSEVSLICVGTPSGSHGESDLSFVRSCVRDVYDAMALTSPSESGHHAVVVRSTVPPGTVSSVVAPVFADGAPGDWDVGLAMCPEFLREGTSVADFYAPPFVVVGTGDPATAATLDRLFDFLPMPVHQVGVETAESLKYACNAFHAVKISFANEVSRVFKPFGVDAREVMEIFCQDTKLNIAPTYLRPAFAYGGSCLPKDLRALQHLARMHDVDAPLLAGTALSNELVVRQVTERVIALDERKVALLGLSFKTDTDDLRESPNVEFAERLIGKGFEVSIFDPIVNPHRLVGANRRYVEARLPHLNRLLARSPGEALDGAGVAVVSSGDHHVHEALMDGAPRHVIDLHGHLGDDIEHLVGYEGVGW